MKKEQAELIQAFIQKVNETNGKRDADFEICTQIVKNSETTDSWGIHLYNPKEYRTTIYEAAKFAEAANNIMYGVSWHFWSYEIQKPHSKLVDSIYMY